MKMRSFEFNLRELAGSMGDFGTLFPLAIGYIYVCGLNPAGFLVMMGLANIATGLIYRLPMPIEPMKVLAVVAISQHWTPSMVYASAFAMGVVWILFAVTGIIEWVAKVTPASVVRGIQASLGVLLAVEAIKLLDTGWLLGGVSIGIVLALRENRYAPAAVVLVVLGAAVMFANGQLGSVVPPGLSLPSITTFTLREVWDTLLLAGFAQIPLTITNATIATAALIRTYWPDHPVTERKLSWSQGIMNAVTPFFGGMPLCHGAGGLAGQYYFGARTGGTNIIEGAIEISLGLFLAGSIAGIFSAFPAAIIGAMMLLVGIELTKFVRDVRIGTDMIPLSATLIIATSTNMAYGFLAGLASHYLISFLLADRVENP
ncbi:MAG: putative sulfate/molybdate transporter [Deltaproteobacteria bacterium]|nr:putative sulfate/molybdate transporter [Deltaproteobacteria bacterium]